MGRPVVATKVGGPPEFVTAQAGVLVDPLDVDAIAAALAAAGELLSQPGGARRGRGPRRAPPGGEDRGDPRAGYAERFASCVVTSG